MSEFPDRDAQLIVGCPAFGLNPKVESLAAMDRHRKHDVILISDSNVRARPSYLRETVCYLADPGVGLVTNLFTGVGEVHPGAVMENLQLNGFIAAGVAAAAVFRATCVVGKSMLLPVKVLQAIGGFAAVRNVLAEDQVIGLRVRQAGYSIRLSHHVVENVNSQPRAQVVLEPSLALVQDPPPARLAGVHCRAGRQPGDRRAGLGFFGRFGRRLGRAVALGRPGHGARRRSDPLAPRVVSQAQAPALQPRQGYLAAAGLARRDPEPPRAVARASLPGRPDDAAAPRARSPPGSPPRVAGAQDSRPERRAARSARQSERRRSLPAISRDWILILAARGRMIRDVSCVLSQAP